MPTKQPITRIPLDSNGFPSVPLMSWSVPADSGNARGMPVLYRHYSESGELLYVGISISVLHRISQHADKSKWFKEVKRIEIEHFNSLAEAMSAEAYAIGKECPKYNVLWRSDGKKLRKIPTPQEMRERLIRRRRFAMIRKQCQAQFDKK